MYGKCAQAQCLCAHIALMLRSIFFSFHLLLLLAQIIITTILNTHISICFVWKIVSQRALQQFKWTISIIYSIRRTECKINKSRDGNKLQKKKKSIYHILRSTSHSWGAKIFVYKTIASLAQFNIILLQFNPHSSWSVGTFQCVFVFVVVVVTVVICVLNCSNSIVSHAHKQF